MTQQSEKLAFWPAFKRWARGFIPALIFLIADPLGCASASDRYSENIFLSLAAFWAPRESVGQNKVTVVLVSPPSLAILQSLSPDGTNRTWPINRGEQYARLISPILSYQPKAIFLDYTLAPQANRQSEDIQDLRDQTIVFLRAEDSKTRLYVADNPLPPSTYRGGCALPQITRRELRAARVTNPEFVKGDWPEDAVEIVDTRFAEPTGRYPLLSAALVAKHSSECLARNVKTSGTYLASPALAMFWQYCKDPETIADQDHHRRVCGKDVVAGRSSTGEAGYYAYAAPTAFGLPIVPFWREYSTRIGRTLMERSAPSSGVPDTTGTGEEIARCVAREKWTSLQGTAQRLWHLLVLSLNGEAEFDIQDHCWAIDHISAESLGWTSGQGVTSEELDKLLRGRYVMIGLDLPEQRDNVPSPVNGQAPGVFIHAVALENLISWGSHSFVEDANAFGLDTADWPSPLARLVSQAKTSEVVALVLAALQSPGGGSSVMFVVKLGVIPGVLMLSRLLWPVSRRRRKGRLGWQMQRIRRAIGQRARPFGRWRAKQMRQFRRSPIGLSPPVRWLDGKIAPILILLQRGLRAVRHYLARLGYEIVSTLFPPLVVCGLMVTAGYAPINWIGLATARLGVLGAAVLGESERTEIQSSARPRLVIFMIGSVIVALFLYGICSAIRG